MAKMSETTTIRISRRTHEALKSLADRRSQSMQTVLDVALEKLEQELLLRQLSEDYAALRRDKKAWKEERKDRALWENTLSDGLSADGAGVR